MTLNKDLLLKYLSMALPYGVKGLRTYNKEEVVELSGILPCNVSGNSDGSFIELQFTNLDCCVIEKYKPYLRPMLSMTDEDKEEMHNLLSPEGTAIYGCGGISMPMNHYGEFVPYEFMNRIIQYLLKNHFDFMGLIPKDLAIEVTESNNPYKE